MQALIIDEQIQHTKTLEEKVVLSDQQAMHLQPSPMVYGMHQSFIKFCMWANILLVSLWHYKNPLKAFKALKALKKLRNDFRGNRPAMKHAKANGKYYFTFNAPGFPSKAFNKYALNNIKRTDLNNAEINLDTVIFGITKKCGYQCEHCFEWEALNKPETLNRKHLLQIIHSFQQLRITQVQLSGGEPLNRFNDILYLLQHIKKGTEVWLYTSGYHFTEERAAMLKLTGLTGITVSLDHWMPALHNRFRGRANAFEWVEKAVANARANDLVVCLSLCATKDFITAENLKQYAALARQWGVSFIQILEPKAVGHYAGKDVSVSNEQVQMLEDFFMDYNYSNAYKDYPLVIYHGFYNRHVACGGGGKRYVYVDTDGDVHNCPFCQRKIFSALHDDIKQELSLMAVNGCHVFNHKKTTV